MHWILSDQRYTMDVRERDHLKLCEVTAADKCLRLQKKQGEDTVIEKLNQMIEDSERIVFFGGAGVSTESGIPDFRSVDGMYRQHWKYPPETILSHHFFVSNTAEFYEFYRTKMINLNARPNAAHHTLAALERAGRLTAIVTQNIDGLHQMAGSQNVLELHGSVHRNYCQSCGDFFDAQTILQSASVPTCHCGGIIKPDVVLYEEGLDTSTVKRALSALAQADLLIVGGTSLSVYPAAGMIEAYCGDRLVMINRCATPADQRASLLIQGSIGEVLSQIRIPSDIR